MHLQTTYKNPKYSILYSQPRVRLFSLEYAQLLAQSKDLEAEVVAETEKSTEIGEESNGKWYHGPAFIA